jgi:bifunctional DNA-binding transcriptional regulator/antitoxin component of YhaV-PrlF toxin-antitoxin module
MPTKENLMAVTKGAHEPEPIALLEDGKVTIPEDLLEEWGIANGATLKVQLEEGTLRLVPLDPEEEARRKHPFVALYEWFAPTREKIRASGISQEELCAVAEVRAAARERDECGLSSTRL